MKIIIVARLLLGLGLAGAGLAAHAAEAPPPSAAPPSQVVVPWATKLFTGAIAVDTPGRIIFMSGLGSEEETTGKILFPGDYAAQCEYAYKKLTDALRQLGGSMKDVVKIVTYVTDVRALAAMNSCRQQAFQGLTLPTHTFLVVSALALPGMVVEVDATAFIAKGN